MEQNDTIRLSKQKSDTTASTSFVASGTMDTVSSKNGDIHELKATIDMCAHCYDILINHFQQGNESVQKRNLLEFACSLPPDNKCPLFVTWDIKQDDGIKISTKEDYHLRGCIGTLSPRELTSSIGEYALTSALKDRRFDPISFSEIRLLRVAVSLLVDYEECLHCTDWIVGVHGIIIKYHDGISNRNATYLPEVALEQGWNQDEAIESLIRKSGYYGALSDDLLGRVKTTRYKSSKYRLTYDDYVELVKNDPVESALASEGTKKCKHKDWRSFFQY